MDGDPSDVDGVCASPDEKVSWGVGGAAVYDDGVGAVEDCG